MAQFDTMKQIRDKRKNPIHRNKNKIWKTIGLVGAVVLVAALAAVLIHFLSAEDISMYVEINGIQMKDGGTYLVRNGDVITVEASGADSRIHSLHYYWGYGSDSAVTTEYGNHITITVPEKIVGYTECLHVEAIAAKEDGTENKDKKTGWYTFYLVYTARDNSLKTEPVYNKDTGALLGMYVDPEQKDRYLEGRGSITLLDGTICAGLWENGKPVGDFTCTFPNGSVYVGPLSDIYRPADNSKGTFTFVDGTTVVFENVSWDDGKKITGEDTAGLYYGMSVSGVSKGYCYIEWEDGGFYRGECMDNMCHGYGAGQNGSGDYYIGEVYYGMPHGQGKMYFADGNVYDGEYSYGVISGKGIMTFADGMIYDGEWVEGAANGQGTGTYADGSVYVGKWVNGIRNGYGTMDYVNGDQYEGFWDQDEPHGQGIMTYANGTVKEGRWEHGEFIS